MNRHTLLSNFENAIPKPWRPSGHPGLFEHRHYRSEGEQELKVKVKGETFMRENRYPIPDCSISCRPGESTARVFVPPRLSRGLNRLLQKLFVADCVTGNIRPLTFADFHFLFCDSPGVCVHRFLLARIFLPWPAITTYLTALYYLWRCRKKAASGLCFAETLRNTRVFNNHRRIGLFVTLVTGVSG